MPDLTVNLDDVETPEVCVFSDRADTFLLGIRLSPGGDDGPSVLLVNTFRPLRLPTVECSECVSAGMLRRDGGLWKCMKP